MRKTYQLDFQKIRRKTQVKDIISFEIYLKNIFSDLAKRDWSEREGKGIEKMSFIEYMNLPFIVGEKLFNVLDKNRNGFLSQTEFVTGIESLYIGGLEETQKIIFNLLDFDLDGKIIPEDSRLLISFIKNLANPPKNIMKIKPRTSLTDEENLEEINLLIKNFFGNKSKLTFEEYKHNIENVNSDVFFLFICFLYNNKPFNESSIKILKLLKKNSRLDTSVNSIISCSSEDCAYDSKFKIKSPSNVFKSFVIDLIDFDLDEMQKECAENSIEEETLDETSSNLTNENSRNISVPTLKTHINLYRLKGSKDYLIYDIKNKDKVGSNVIKNTYNNFVKRMQDLVIDDSRESYVITDKTEAATLAMISNKNKKKYKYERNESIEMLSTSSNKNITIKKNGFNKEFLNDSTTYKKTKTKENKNAVSHITTEKPDNNNSASVNYIHSLTYEKLPIINISGNDYCSNANNIKNDGFLQSSGISINANSDGLGLISTSGKNQSSAKNLFTSGNESAGSEEIIYSDIIYENYIFKSRNNNKLKKYYIVLMGMDLFYFSHSDKKKLRGMHNLSGSYIFEDDNIIKVREEYSKSKNEPSTVLYYPFKLYFKKKARIYYCSNEEEAKLWIKHIRAATKFKEIREFYDFGEELGSGKFGKVKLGFNKKTKKKVAIKSISKANLKGTEVEMVKTEIEIMKFCRHKNIVRLVDNYEDMDNIYIVLEYLSGGNLNFFLSQQQTLLTEERIKNLINQMASAIYYLHYFGIIHRDLKPENTMMTDISEDANIKIVDFGLSKILGITEKSNEAYGTLSYAAPEVIMKSDYNNKVDIWSLGIVMYFLICGYLPFSDKNNNFSKIAADITGAPIKYDPKIWSRISPNCNNLVMKCLERDIKKRLNILQFLEHPWFDKI